MQGKKQDTRLWLLCNGAMPKTQTSTSEKKSLTHAHTRRYITSKGMGYRDSARTLSAFSTQHSSSVSAGLEKLPHAFGITFGNASAEHSASIRSRPLKSRLRAAVLVCIDIYKRAFALQRVQMYEDRTCFNAKSAFAQHFRQILGFLSTPISTD